MKLRNYFTFRAPLLLSAAGLLSLVMATLAQPALPNINTNNIFNITNYGAVGDGVITNTTAIQAAIAAAAAATAGVGGGTVEIPGPGTYLCGPLTMQSKVNLQIDTNATLLFLPENKYPNATGSPASPITFGSLTDVVGRPAEPALHDLFFQMRTGTDTERDIAESAYDAYRFQEWWREHNHSRHQHQHHEPPRGKYRRD